MRLRAGDHELVLEAGRPLLMGIVNVNADSTASRLRSRDPAAQVEQALELREHGAAIVDVGAESGRTDRPPADPAAEAALLVPVVTALAARGVVVSVDTFKPEVARAVVDAGAAIVNDVSGLADPELADVAAASGAALVVMHTRAAPKTARFPGYADAMGDVLALLRDRIALARDRGVAPEQLIVDPGPDFAKTPQETVDVLRRLPDLAALERPVLLAVSRKYFLGVITGREPEDRLAGTLAAVAQGVDAGAHVLRVHDVRAVRDFLEVRAALAGDGPIVQRGRLDDEALKWLPAPDDA